MYIAPADATLGQEEWRPSWPLTRSGTSWPPETRGATSSPSWWPTQFVLEGDVVWLHRVRANPVFDALAENPRVVLSVADDWAFIPSSWKAIGQEDPTLGIPATYYGAVQLIGRATVHDARTDPCAVARILRRQLATAEDLPVRRGRGEPGGGAHGQADRGPADAVGSPGRARPMAEAIAPTAVPLA